MITEILDILALAVRAVALCMKREPSRKRIYLKRYADDGNDSVENVWTGGRRFLQIRKVRTRNRRKT